MSFEFSCDSLPGSVIRRKSQISTGLELAVYKGESEQVVGDYKGTHGPVGLKGFKGTEKGFGLLVLSILL